MRRLRKSAGDSVKCVKLLSSILRTQVGEDEAPSPFLQQLGTLEGMTTEEIELAQDIALLTADIMDEIANAAARGNLRSSAVSIAGIVITAAAEIQDNVRWSSMT
jgi:hypothetical protein